MSNNLSKYFKVSKEEHTEEQISEVVDEAKTVEVVGDEQPSVVSLSTYEPLSPERVAELQASVPHPENKLDLSQIKNRIKVVTFNTNTQMRQVSCIIEMDNGYRAEGTTWVADPENHNQELGMHYAYQKAFTSLIPIATFLWFEGKMTGAVDKE